MKVVSNNSYNEGPIDFSDYISMQYRQKNKNNGSEATEREQYRRLYQNRIQREQFELQNEKYGNRTRNNSASTSVSGDWANLARRR